MLDLVLINDTLTQFENELESNCNSLSNGFRSFLENLIFDSELQKKFSKPMVWIGIYIAIASLFCILPMVADLLHGFKNKKLCFPCKYFTLKAASLTVIAIAMKLPVANLLSKLLPSMPGVVGQAAKF
ncbi:hypothetical protein HanPI659440_Chr08g0294501 [Helianthus annuus]|nr:hypothetical protein HanPI659440_Chr08g0294501 [Helianthus annuus]